MSGDTRLVSILTTQPWGHNDSRECEQRSVKGREQDDVCTTACRAACGFENALVLNSCDALPPPFTLAQQTRASTSARLSSPGLCAVHAVQAHHIDPYMQTPVSRRRMQPCCSAGKLQCVTRPQTVGHFKALRKASGRPGSWRTP